MRARYSWLLRAADDAPPPGATRVLREVFWRPAPRTSTPEVVDLFPRTDEAQRDPR